MNYRTGITMFVSSLFGAGVWAVSPWLTGCQEPWDAASGYYPGGLFITGVAAGLVLPQHIWAHYLGTVVGQLAYEMLFLRGGPLFLVGAVFVFVFSLVSLLGVVVGSQLRTRSRARTKGRDEHVAEESVNRKRGHHEGTGQGW